ncbi:MAG: class I SAM-dependent RNA methyltransferase [Bacteroides sp.]|nr:class I SAM-dependent RNA methyltransferase [Eubacterium sp.]MCM1417351.1 class I SAM-dependent RNA methyltransferase [Roseburia sp.]MCM1461456.1 class I SAM-dependent RNA methyltransferase [Bacteroides sp.]
MIDRLTAPCHFGLEKTLAFELKRAGGEGIEVRDGRVDFSGDEAVVARANITSSVAERIGIVLGSFRAGSFDELFEGARAIPIEEYAAKDEKLHIVKGNSLNSALTSIPAIQRTLKKAFVLRMQEKYRLTTLPETGATLPIRFLLMKDQITVTLDTSGVGLHKRGYRARSNAAPIKETLAAGIVDLARVREYDTVVDPFCGSGTILIEAAMKAARIAPGLNRRFVAETWSKSDPGVWAAAFEEARAAVREDCSFRAFGYDLDPEAVALTEENARKAGVEGLIAVKRRSIREFTAPSPKIKLITNPPYAERMGEVEEAHAIYRTMGERLLPLGESELYVITSDGEFEALFGEKAAKNRKLYNGMLQCRLYSYRG